MADPKDLSTQLPINRQCTATSKQSGERCRRMVQLGYTVCFIHGARSRGAQEKAKLRLIALVEPALATVATIMATSDSDALRLRAAENVLDRGGLPRGVTISGDDARALLAEKLLAYRDKAGLPEPDDNQEMTDE
jgi:hypothetical protein